MDAGMCSGYRRIIQQQTACYKMSAIISNAIITAIAFITRSPTMSIAHLSMRSDGTEGNVFFDV
jgi:hypothetical protein